MNIVKSCILVSSLSVLTACSVEKQMASTGGSKADGIVKMSYEYGAFEVPVVDKKQGMKSANKRCKAWGYKRAEPFEASTQKCVASSSSGCNRTRVTTEYQCLN